MQLVVVTALGLCHLVADIVVSQDHKIQITYLFHWEFLAAGIRHVELKVQPRHIQSFPLFQIFQLHHPILLIVVHIFSFCLQ